MNRAIWRAPAPLKIMNLYITQLLPAIPYLFVYAAGLTIAVARRKQYRAHSLCAIICFSALLLFTVLFSLGRAYAFTVGLEGTYSLGANSYATLLSAVIMLEVAVNSLLWVCVLFLIFAWRR